MNSFPADPARPTVERVTHLMGEGIQRIEALVSNGPTVFRNQRNCAKLDYILLSDQ